jgi:multidrug resistance efflux pump
MKYFIRLLIVLVFLSGCSQIESSEPVNTSPQNEIKFEDSTISASGTVIPETWAYVAFTLGGNNFAQEVSVGDSVEKGDLLAKLDNSSEQIQFEQAERNLLELTSPTALAEAKRAVAQAEDEVDDATNLLKYYISPSVVYWEEQVEEAQEKLASAQEEAQSSPSDETQKAVDDAERLLNSAERSLGAAWFRYEETYREETFSYEDCSDPFRKSSCETKINAPSQATIDDTRYRLEVAQLRIVEAESLLTALKEGEIAEGATGLGVAELERAQLNFENAKNNLELTRLYAPISGTIIEIYANEGEIISSGVPAMLIADLDSLQVQTSDLNEIDVVKIHPGDPVLVLFDALPEVETTGMVIDISQINADVAGVYYTVKIELDEIPDGLLWGMSAFVKIEVNN